MEHQTFKRNKKSNLDYKIGFNDGRRLHEAPVNFSKSNQWMR